MVQLETIKLNRFDYFVSNLLSYAICCTCQPEVRLSRRVLAVDWVSPRDLLAMNVSSS